MSNVWKSWKVWPIYDPQEVVNIAAVETNSSGVVILTSYKLWDSCMAPSVPNYMKSVSWCCLRRAHNWFGETLGGWEFGRGREWGGGGQFTSNLVGWVLVHGRIINALRQMLVSQWKSWLLKRLSSFNEETKLFWWWLTI
jgi:hypothetical protein